MRKKIDNLINQLGKTQCGTRASLNIKIFGTNYEKINTFTIKIYSWGMTNPRNVAGYCTCLFVDRIYEDQFYRGLHMFLEKKVNI